MSKDKKSVYKPKAISGYPEWLPEERFVEQQWFDHIRKVFESYGFCSIETPSVEELDVLRAKGEVDKEIYVLERLHKEDDDDSEARLALHFDQTVPLARYVAQHFNDLVFPFKRYQMQRVWRGERPQAGRFREFYQCDIDVINVDALPLHFDAEMPAIIWETLSALPGMAGEKIQLRISNRKILLGLLDALGISDEQKVDVTRTIDKIEKIGEDAVKKLLQETGLSNSNIDEILKLATNKNLSSVEAKGEMMAEGLSELQYVMDYLKDLPEGAAVADLSIVRGLDYYTGTVYETVFVEDPGYGSICSGGRYDDLAGSYINKALPGVGISIGFSRLFDRLRQQGKFDTSRKSPADILMTLPKEEDAEEARKIARILRQRGFNVEMFHRAQKIQKQFTYAEKKGIPYVWLPDLGEVKSLADREQVKADPQHWTPTKDSQNAKVA
ncbi:MAG TPA: histidine--tRNA ligase [Micavibrio sp.]|nr:histidine--tRNA ligase [Micavibrio sp.]HIL28001.1 histidine--tRNA ligase [Micavibrio sp.]